MRPPFRRGQWVAHGGDERIGAYHHVVPDAHFPIVKDYHVVIDEEIVPDMNILAIVAVKRWKYNRGFPRAAEST